MDSFEQFPEPQLASKDERRHLQDRLHPHSKGVQPLRHDRPWRLSQLLSVKQSASRISKTCASNIIVLIPPIVTPPLVCLGKLFLK